MLTGKNKTPEDDIDKKRKVVYGLKTPNNIDYNDLILAQEDGVCFQIVEEAKTKYNMYGETRKAWKKISRKNEQTTGVFKAILHKKFAK